MKITVSRRNFISSAALAGSSLAFPTVLRAQQATELVLSSWLPPRHALVTEAVQPWARDIDTATNGRVRIRVLVKPLGSPPSHFDMARDGIADITYGLHSFTLDDRFVNSRVGQFSFLGNDAVTTSEAFWTVYTERLGARQEHAGTQLLSLFSHGPGMLHNNKRQIGTIDDLKGLKIRVPGGYIADLLSHFGVEPVFTSSGEVYEKLSRGVVDGAAFPYDAIYSFKLADYLKYTTTFPGGLYNTSWFLVMNQAKWNAIAPEDQAAITELSGAAFAKRVGAAWDSVDAEGKKVADTAGVAVEAAPPAVLDPIRTEASALEAKWADSLAQGFDGRAALAGLRKMTGIAP